MTPTPKRQKSQNLQSNAIAEIDQRWGELYQQSQQELAELKKQNSELQLSLNAVDTDGKNSLTNVDRKLDRWLSKICYIGAGAIGLIAANDVLYEDTSITIKAAGVLSTGSLAVMGKFLDNESRHY